jgi:phage-related protein
MAIVGDAYVVVRAITSSVERDIQKAFNGVDRVGERAGKDLSDGVNRGFSRSGNNFNFITPQFLKEAESARERFSSLTRAGYALAPALTALGGIIGLLGTGLISLTSIIGAAATPALITLAGAFTAAGQAAITLRLAFSGVAKAVQAGTKASKKTVSSVKSEEAAQRNLLAAYERLAEARETAIEQLQQLGFDSEDAAISEKKAALELEKARETLARVSDLPPNSRARKEAELAFAEADLNYRRAIDRNNDLKKSEAANAKLGPDVASQVNGSKIVLEATRNVIEATEARDAALQGSGTDAYQDALSGLSKEAQNFVKYLVSIQSEFKKLRDAAGQKLFPQLETAIDNLVKNLFPALRPLLTATGDVLGKVAIRISEVVTSSENIKRLESIWKTNNKFIDNLGSAVANLYEGFLILLKAAKPLIDAFGEFLKNTTGSWKETLKLDEATGKLTERFRIAQGILKDLGTIFGNVFAGFKNIVKANVGPGSAGEIFLDYFKDISLAFKNLETIDGKPLREFFADAAENGTKLLSLLGNILGGFITLADNPELGVFLDQLSEVTDIFQEIGEDITAALPSFGEFLITFAEFIKLVTESGSIKIFFDVLTSVLGTLNKILESPVGQFFLKLSAAILPVLGALGLIGKISGFAFKVAVGGIIPLIRFYGLLTGSAKLAALTTSGLQAKIASLAATAIRTAGTAMLQLAKAIGGQLAGAFKALGIAMRANPLGVFLTVVGLVLAAIGILYTKSETFRNLVNGIGTAIKNAFSGTIDFLKNNWPLILSILTGPIGAAVIAIARNWDSIVATVKGLPGRIRAAASGLWDGIKDSFKNAINYIIERWNALQFNLRFPDKIFGIPLGPLAGKGFTLDTPNIKPLAKGGIIMPSAGGTLAQIGEAGRPERVEPLDPDGLSKRDKAMIEMLSGGRGSGINITINPSAGMDERELASIVSRQIAFQLRKGAA